MANNVKNLISIITPVFNVEKYFERCADSILSQTHTNLEIIFISVLVVYFKIGCFK